MHENNIRYNREFVITEFVIYRVYCKISLSISRTKWIFLDYWIFENVRYAFK